MKSLIIWAAIAAATILTVSMDFADAAEVSDGSASAYLQQQSQLHNMSGYSLGTATAHIGDGSSPGYYTPRFSGGTGG
jgi:hypothetical protein